MHFLKSFQMSIYVYDGMKITTALEKVYKVITKVSRQTPKAHRGDAHKVEFLSSAVAGYDWATEPLGRVATKRLTFQQLYGEIESQLELSKEAEVAKLKDETFTTKRGRNLAYSTHLSGVLCTSQGNYARKPYTVRFSLPKERSFNARKRTGSFDSLSIAGCFNCGNELHMVKQYRKPLNIARAAG